jgi:Rieske Fe-S protein
VSVPTLTRRSALTGAAIAAVAAVAGYVVARNSAAAEAKPAAAAANGYGPSTSDGSAGSGGTPLAKLDQIPAGGGLIVAKSDVVLVRDSAGAVHAFSATCTHQGCQVDSVRDNQIGCPCHGSVFDATTGAVVSGPAGRPLPKVSVVVREDEVFTT